MKRGYWALCLAVLMLLVACESNEKWTIKGSVDGAEGDTVFVKHLVDNQYQTVDEKVLKADGKFSFKLEKNVFPEFYFVQVNDESPLVVVRDSSDIVEVSAASSNLSQSTIVGSDVSVRIQECNDRVKALRHVFYKYQKAEAEDKEAIAEQFRTKYVEVKDYIGQEIYNNPKSLYAYYALYQRIDNDNLLFSPFVNEDYKYFAAVATSYDVFRKDDPRTKALYDMVMSALKVRREEALKQMVEEAPDVVPDIVKKDINGKEHKLSDYNNKIVILNFWMSQSEDAQNFNASLKPLYAKYHKRGLEVFQVSSDQSKLLWEAAVKNAKLPWISLCDCSNEMDRDFLTYNVKRVPTTYLIGKGGKMINRFDDIKALEKAIKEAL